METNEFCTPFRLNKEREITINLATALMTRNLTAFRDALEKGANPYLPITIENEKICVLEKALNSDRRSEFVAECIQDNWNYSDYISPNLDVDTYLTNLQPGSHDFQFFSHLLQFDDFPVESEPINLTLVNSLAKNITSENFDNIFNCIKKLIEYGADPNIPDDQGITPILHIIKNKVLGKEYKKTIIEYLMDLQYPKIDIDSYGPGQENARMHLRRNYRQIQLPLSDTSELNFHILSVILRQKQEEHFIQRFQKYHSNLSNIAILDEIKQKNYINLLLTAIRKGLNKAVEAVIQTEVDLNVEQRGKTALKIACMVGNREALQMLLQQNNVNLYKGFEFDVSLYAATNETKEASELGDFMGCFDAFLSSSKIDEKGVEFYKIMSLSRAAKSENEKVIMSLLEKGAYMGFLQLMPNFNPKILEEFFDKCITSNCVSLIDDDLHLIINYKNFIANITNEDMMPLKQIAECENAKHLLKHPLIQSFLYLKWDQLSLFFYTNFIVSFLSCVFLITYILLDFNNAAKETIIIFKRLSYLGYAYIIARECIQWFSLRQQMFASKFFFFINCLELIFIILTMLTFSHANYKNEPQRSFAVLTILLASVEIYLLIGSIPILTFSTHMLMLKEVCVSFIMSFSQYFIFFVTFGLCFHMVFINPEDSETLDNDDGYFNSTLGSIFKSLVMVTGEFDSRNINFSSPTSYGIFLFFVVFMSIVLLNLLNGLAVSDTQMIRAQAELNELICCTHNLASLDKSINFLKNTRPFSLFCGKLKTFLRDIIVRDKIIIFPNDGNKIYTYKKFNTNSTSMKRSNKTVYIKVDDEGKGLSDLQCLWLSCFGVCFKIYFKMIVPAALGLIEKQQRLQDEQKLTLEHEIRLKNVEKNIELITASIQKLTQ